MKGGAVLLPHDHHPVGIGHGNRVFDAVGYEGVPVQNAVVLVGDQLADHVLILGSGQEHQVLQRIAQVSAVVHVHVGGSAVPSPRGHIDHRRQHQADPGDLAGTDLHLLAGGPVLQSLDRLERHFPRGQSHFEFSAGMEQRLSQDADPSVAVSRWVEFPRRLLSHRSGHLSCGRCCCLAPPPGGCPWDASSGIRGAVPSPCGLHRSPSATNRGRPGPDGCVGSFEI